ncbi:hypothetical protein JB92DRAFT_101750 [Gautieria morchelliformis]|nr:hypothetical protein JB92DRAFT_101750 [Gautieria morchelliformis]
MGVDVQQVLAAACYTNKYIALLINQLSQLGFNLTLILNIRNNVIYLIHCATSNWPVAFTILAQAAPITSPNSSLPAISTRKLGGSTNENPPSPPPKVTTSNIAPALPPKVTTSMVAPVSTSTASLASACLSASSPVTPTASASSASPSTSSSSATPSESFSASLSVSSSVTTSATSAHSAANSSSTTSATSSAANSSSTALANNTSCPLPG